MSSFEAADHLDLAHTAQGELFVDGEPVWRALDRIGGWLEAAEGFENRADVAAGAHVGERVHLGKGTVVEHGAVVQGPAWIGDGCTIRSGAYVRSNVIVGAGAMLGNSCEFKNCLLFDEAEVPHFSYVGDAILGFKAHLGAGVILSNVRLDRANVRLRDEGGGFHDTGLQKFSAIVGDRAEVGCNSVISPGSIIGRDSVLYPGTHWSGELGANRIVKTRQTHQVVERNL